MGSQLLSILRQGFWASLTGGWFYDQRQAHFVNVFHLYVWLLLLCLPLSVQIFMKTLLSESLISWSIYCVFISVLFITIKLVNAYLHHLYDTGECVTEDEEEPHECFEDSKHKENRDSNRLTNSQLNDGNYTKREEEANAGSLADDMDFARSLMSGSCARLNNMMDQETNRRDSIPLKLMTSTRVDSNDDLVNTEQCSSVMKTTVENEDSQKPKDTQDTKSLQCNITMNPSVIDLEVDVHHRNSSGSSIVACGSVSSSSAASGRLTTTTTVASGMALTPGEANDSVVYDESLKASERHRPVMKSRRSADSLSNDSSEEVITTQSASSEAILKGSSYGELGFMAQDPSVMRNIASGSHQESQLRTFKPNVRGEAGFAGRRARSELETTNYYGGDTGQGALMPPSHPVSLEVIGTSCETGDLGGNATERLIRTVPKKIKFSSVEILNNQRRCSVLPSTKSASVVSDTINPIDELSSDEQLKQDNAQLNQPSSPLSPTVHLQESFDSKSPEESEEFKPVFADDDEQETDVSLVVNIPTKHVLQRKKAIRKGFRPKFGKQSTKKPKLIGGDCLLRSSPSDESDESEDSGESSYTFDDCCPAGRTSISSTQSDTNSDNEKTPLTSSMNESSLKPRICRPSVSKSKLQRTATSPLGSGHSLEPNDRFRDQFQTKEAEKLDCDFKKLRLEIDKRTTKRHQHQLRRHREHREQNRFKRTDGCSDEIQEGYQQFSGTEAVLTPSPIQTLSASTSEGPPAYLLARILATPGTHLAKSHDDTSPGAVHCFQDERGNWLTYIFDENSQGTARGLMNADNKNLFLNYPPTFGPPKWDSSSSSSDSNVVLDAPANILHTPRQTIQTRASNTTFHNNETTSSHTLPRFLTSTNSLLADPFPTTTFSPLRSTRRIPHNLLSEYGNFTHTLNSTIADLSLPIQLRFPDFVSPEPTPPKRKQYYKLWIPPCFRWKYTKIWFDRLQLLALLDRSLTKIELVTSIILAVLVAVLGSLVIEKGYFQDLWLFLFCFVIASCHYTLLKSVQPDAASPTHGYNRIIIYSRPVYFIVCCSLICFCQYYVENKFSWTFVIYGINLFNPAYINCIGEMAKVFVLAFPLVFTLGLMPQINTFLMHLLEQIDVHIFGGTAATMGLTSSFYCIFRSLATVGVLYAFALISTTKLVGHTKVDYDVVFSVFCGFLVFFAYHLSRSSSDPTVYWNLIVKYVFKRKDKSTKDWGNKVEETNEESQEKEYIDPLPEKMEKTLLSRLENDIILSILITIFVFAIHVSTIFTLQPYVEKFLQIFAVCWGLLLHYFLTNFRKELPWLCFSQPTLKSEEYDMFEVKGEAKLMWFERLQAWMWLIEKNFIYPLVFLSAITTDTPVILKQFGVYFGTLLVVVCTFKCIRSSFNDSTHNHLILLFTYLFFKHDFSFIKEPFLVNFFMASIAYHKFYEFLLKIRFVITYVAPWQITWGSAFHAFAQPFNVPHSGLLFVQAAISSLLSSPLQPLLGSAIFLMSYVRPVKFWERDYNTKRVDNSNTRLINQLERNQLGNDDNNLNSIFYEHLTRSLQHSLYGDVFLGRWGPVSQGDCFVLASDNLNCLLHVIELGNGLLTFQVRGLEFRGTYCQQREVEAISEGVNEDEACCCCEPGHLPGMLSLNAAFNQRWLAWEVTNTKYVLEGYSISDNSALSMLQPYDLRKALITYYVKSVIYFTVINKRLDKWCKLVESMDKNLVDFDITFNVSVDEDYDFRVSGITKSSFSAVYSHWIKSCISRRNLTLTENEKDLVITLCFYLSLLARRALSAASHHNSFNSVEFLLYGLHSLFKGDFRVTSPRDEWVFQDINLLNLVIAPSVRMAVKLHQDHFMSTDEYDDDSLLYAAITNYRKEYVISHEADPVWRNAVLSNVPSLLALRHVFDDGTDQYKIIMLNKRYLSFRVIKVNRECVRGLWAGQQQELVYLRNRNPERGSIQNAKQALRNIINSSCDQPIGYPIYVSPLTTSFAETNEQLSKILGRPLSFGMFKRFFTRIWYRLRTRCGEGCSSGGTVIQEDNPEEIMMRSMSSISTCRHRQDMHRGSHRRDSGNEYDTPQTLQGKSKTMRHPSLTYQHLQLNKDLTITSSTLVNLSAFRPLETEQRDAVVVL